MLERFFPRYHRNQERAMMRESAATKYAPRLHEPCSLPEFETRSVTRSALSAKINTHNNSRKVKRQKYYTQNRNMHASECNSWHLFCSSVDSALKRRYALDVNNVQ
jgi:hypothetical protein